MYVTEREKEREIDRKKDSMEKERERQPDSCPLGELGLFFGPLSDSFLSYLTAPLPPLLYFSESRPMCFLWALAPGICLPASTPPSLLLALSDTLLCTFSRVP